MESLRPSPRTLRLTLPLACLLAISGSAAAQPETPRWHLRFGGLLVDGDQAFTAEDDAGSSVLAGGNAEIGAGAAVEYRFSERFGLEFGAAFAEVPNYEDASTSPNDDVEIGEGPSYTPLTASLAIHLTPGRRADLYFGPTLAFVQYGDFELDLDHETIEYEVEDDFAWGATLGVDVGIGDSGWSISAAGTYLTSDMEIRQRGSSSFVVVPFDPVMVRMGAAFSF